MDTTPKYCLMSEKAEKVLNIHYELAIGDFIWSKSYKVVGIITRVSLIGDAVVYDVKENCSVPVTITCRLHRQDQLQEMVGKSLSWLVWDFEEFTEGMTDNSFFKDKSMEQLWLAFVMKEKYQKVWNGKDWVHEKN